MNKERLLKLAAHLDTVAPETFDLENWKCGATACAVGHACMMPEFLEAELMLGVGGLGGYTPVFRERRGWLAVECFFELAEDDAAMLFMDAYYQVSERNPKGVAAHIREFCGGR